MFKSVKKQVLDQFNAMVATGRVLFLSDADKEEMWDAYLLNFDDLDERQHHNCNCCKQFIRHYGNIVIIEAGKLITVWDFIPTDIIYVKPVANLGNIVRSSPIRNRFLNEFVKLGTDGNYGIDKSVTWEHFHVVAPNSIKVAKDKKETALSEYRTTKQVFKRSLDELTIEATEIVLDLIAQGSLYRGKEFEGLLQSFLNAQKEYALIPTPEHKDMYTWDIIGSNNFNAVTRIRNTAIGTLLIDLSENRELDFAVSAWEKVMAPTNYKRPTALISKGMIEQAEKEIAILGIEDSLGRRFATTDDISVAHVLFVNRDAKKAANVFEEMKEEVQVSPKTFSKVEEVSIDKFIKEVLPTATGVEVLLDNSHLNNLVSLIAPKDEKAPGLFKWNNPFSWSYVNALTDSGIKEKVKAAGGNVNGVIRISLSWFNYDDLDIHVAQPNGVRIGFDTFRKPIISHETGQLDVDMNATGGVTRQGVENITWTDKDKMLEGEYIVRVNQFTKREVIDHGFVVEMEHDSQLYTFENNKAMAKDEWVTVCKFTYSKTEGIKITEGNAAGNLISQEKWGISTNKFQKVSIIMNSPNYWDDAIGNKHTFFVIEGAKNDETPRGFFNEFLKEELSKNRKVFEVLGAKLKVEPSDQQVTGVGFSDTQRNSVICRVDGKFKRVIKVNF